MKDGAERTLRGTVLGCLAAACVVLVAAALLGHAAAGLAIAFGLLLGSANGWLARRGLTSGVPVGAGSLARMLFLSAIALGVAFLVGIETGWLALLGLGAAQLILAASAARELIRG
jgi:hypothetical protein